MGRVVHFEIPADDPQRAVAFYEKVFNWKLGKWGGPEDYWLAETGAASEPGINGAIARRDEQPRMRCTVNSIAVDSVDQYIDKVDAAGGHATTPKLVIPGVGYVAYCTDTEGNYFGIVEFDPSAR